MWKMWWFGAVYALSSIFAGAALAEEKTPISYEVKDNNRIFLAGEGQRYVNDLNLYIRCVASGPNGSSKEPPCPEYRENGMRGTRPRELVPDLRTGAARDEYKTVYDKALQRYPEKYVLDKVRKIKFLLDKSWMDAQQLSLVQCIWTISTSSGQNQIVSPFCAPVLHEIELTISGDGADMSWSATVSVDVELSGGERKEFSTPATVRDYLIVAMGDSLTAGEGNPERNRTNDLPAQWLDYRCHRSLFSYPMMAATLLALADPRHSITLVHVACSGADIVEGLLGEYEGAISRKQAKALWGKSHNVGHWASYGTNKARQKLRPQVEEVQGLLADGSRARRPDLLLMSIGVNDVGLVPLLTLLAKNDCRKGCQEKLRQWRTTKQVDCSDRSDRLRRSFDCLEHLLRTAQTEIGQKIAPRRTYLVEYPNPLRDNKNNLCMTSGLKHDELLKGMLGTFGAVLNRLGILKLSHEEIAFAESEFYLPLMSAHRGIERVPDWITIRYVDAENKRGFCAKPSWYHNFNASTYRQGLNPGSRRDSVGTLHPNAIGHEHIMVRVLSQLRRDRLLSDHNLSKLQPDDFTRAKQIDGYEGLAWFLGNKHREEIERYFKF